MEELIKERIDYLWNEIDECTDNGVYLIEKEIEFLNKLLKLCN